MKKQVLNFVIGGNFLRICFALLVAGIIIFSVNACTNSGSAKSVRWEYIILNLDFGNELYDANNELNILGEEGWELVSVSPRPGWNSTKYLHYLKRRLQ